MRQWGVNARVDTTLVLSSLIYQPSPPPSVPRTLYSYSSLASSYFSSSSSSSNHPLSVLTPSLLPLLSGSSSSSAPSPSSSSSSSASWI
eukprot:3924705-Pyramimonas_sp.AAC.1